MAASHYLIRSLSVLTLAVVLTASASAQTATSDRGKHSLRSNAVSFIENRGQIVDSDGKTRSDILFTAGSENVRVFLTQVGISYVFARSEASPIESERGKLSAGAEETGSVYRMDMRLEGANFSVPVTREEPTGEIFNYYLPHCPEGVVGARAFRRLTYHDVYENIDLVLYGAGNGLKYEFVVRPGGRVADIRLRYVGAQALGVGADGRLRIVNPLGKVEEEAPVTFELATKEEGRGRLASASVRSRFAVEGDVVTFNVGSYRKDRTLVIDPSLAWATYYGGSDQDAGYGVATDFDDNVLVAGLSRSNNFPTTPGAVRPSSAGQRDVVIVKFDKFGARLWATYYGGSNDDNGDAIVADAAGNVVVTGSTSSNDYPVTPGPLYTSTLDGRNDVLVLKLDRTGARLWATRFGGTGAGLEGNDQGHGVAVDAANNIAIVGSTASDRFPVTSGAYQATYGGSTPGFGGNDAFVVKLDPDGRQLWGTFLGGSYGEEGNGAAFDAAGNVFATGMTISFNFPTTANAFQKSRDNTKAGLPDAFVAKLDPNGAASWVSYYGGNDADVGNGIATNPAGNSVVSGRTASSNFPLRNASQGTLRGRQNGFVAMIDPAGQPVWSTYYGGSGSDEAKGIAVCPGGNILVAGGTTSSDMQVFGPGTSYILPYQADFDAFAANFSDGGTPLWATYFGGGGYDQANAVTTDRYGDVVLAGATRSVDMPDSSAVQPALGGGEDAMVVRFNCCCAHLDPLPVAGDSEICENGTAQLYADEGKKSYVWSNGQTGISITITEPGPYSYTAYDSLGCRSDSKVWVVRQLPAPFPAVAKTGPTRFCRGDSVTLSAQPGFVSYLWSNGSTAESITVRDTGVYVLTVTDAKGCIGAAEPIRVEFIPPPEIPEISICSNMLTAPSGLTTYLWKRDGSAVPGGDGPKLLVSETGLYTVTVTDPNGCQSISPPFPLSKVEIATTTVALPILLASPGDTVTVPLVLVSATAFPENAIRDFTIRIRTNRSVLFPLEPVESMQDDGPDRIFTIRRTRDGSGNVLSDLKFIVGLGDVVQAPIEIDAFLWSTDCPVLVAELDGELRMEDLCTAGGTTRLFLQDGELLLKQNTPNPAVSTTEIEYSVIEKGRTRLYMIDMLGRTVATLVDREATTPGTDVVTFDADAFAPGLYYYVLETPTGRTARVMQVGK